MNASFSPQHVESAAPIHRLIALLVFGLGAILILGGIYLAFLSKSAETKFSLLGNEFSSTSVGLSMAFIGVVMVVSTFRRILRSIDHLGALPSTTPPSATTSTLPDGKPIPPDKREAFTSTWHSLIALETAGEELWDKVSRETLSNFSNHWIEANKLVRNNALFFSDADYDDLIQILEAADFYLDGKRTLSDIYRIGLSEKDMERFRVEEKIQLQIDQNRRWLNRYTNLLAKIRNNFRKGLN
jgi:hypothetical protein